MKKLMSAEKKMKEEESKCTNFNFLRETKKKVFFVRQKYEFKENIIKKIKNNNNIKSKDTFRCKSKYYCFLKSLSRYEKNMFFVPTSH